MVWVKFEDGYPRNRKVVALSDAAFRLDVSAICWSNATGADGRILAHELGEVRAKATARHAAELVAKGRWHVAGTPCPNSETCPASSPQGGGWVIHDIWAQQPSAAKTAADRKAKAERQAKWIASKKGASRDASHDTPADASHDVSEDVAPSPPRPAPKEAGAGTPPKQPAAAGSASGPAAGRADAPLAETVDIEAIQARQRADQAEHERRVAEREATNRRGAAAAREALRRTA